MKYQLGAVPLYYEAGMYFGLEGDGHVAGRNPVSRGCSKTNRDLFTLSYEDIVASIIRLSKTNDTSIVSFANATATYISNMRGWSEYSQYVAVAKVMFGKSIVGHVYKGLGYVSSETYNRFPAKEVEKYLMKNTFKEQTSIHSVQVSNTLYGVVATDVTNRGRVSELERTCGLLVGGFNSNVRGCTGEVYSTSGWFFVENKNMLDSLYARMLATPF